MKTANSTIAVAAAAACTLLAAVAAEAKELKLATFMGPKHHLNRVVFPKLAKAVGEATGGETTIKLYTSGQLGKGPVQQYKRVRQNVAEIAFSIQGYTSSIFPRTMVIAQAGVGTDAVDVTRKVWAVYDEFLAPEYKDVKVLGIWSNSPPVLMAKKGLIQTMADLKGLKVRALDATNVPQMDAWGASGVHIAISGVYDALDKGVIDVVNVVPNALFGNWRFGELAKFVTDGMDAPTSMFWLAMNKDVWESLPSKSKAAIDKVTGVEFSVETARSWAETDVRAMAQAKEGKDGIKVYTLSAAEAARFDAATAKTVEEFLAKNEAKGVPARAIYSAVRK